MVSGGNVKKVLEEVGFNLVVVVIGNIGGLEVWLVMKEGIIKIVVEKVINVGINMGVLEVQDYVENYLVGLKVCLEDLLQLFVGQDDL